MSTIKDNLEKLKILNTNLKANMRNIGLAAEDNEKFNSLINRLFTKTNNSGDILYLPWFNLKDYEGTDTSEILSHLRFTETPASLEGWMRNVKDPTLILNLSDFIDFSKKPSIKYLCYGIQCKELILKDADLSYTTGGTTNYTYFLGNTCDIGTLRIENCTFSDLDKYDQFMFDCDSNTKVKLKEVYLKDITMRKASPLGALWGLSKVSGLEKLYIENATLDKLAGIRYMGSPDTLKEFYCDNISCNTVDNYEGMQELLAGCTALESVILKNCNLNKMFNHTITNTYQNWYGIESSNLRTFSITDVELDTSFKKPNLYIPHSTTPTKFKNLELVDLSNWRGNITTLYDVSVSGSLIANSEVVEPKYIIFKMDNLDVSNVTDISKFLYEFGRLNDLDTMNTWTGVAKVTNANEAFGCFRGRTGGNYQDCNIKEIDLKHFDFSNCTSMRNFFSQAGSNGYTMYPNRSIKKILGTIDCSSVRTMVDSYSTNTTFSGLAALEEMPALLNLGKGINPSTTTMTCGVNLSSSSNLKYECIIDILNNLYDLNLIYDTANGGSLVRQEIRLGSTNLAKLTPEEIAIATNKGWTIN